MALSVHDALVYLMIVASAADRDITPEELDHIGTLVDTMPVFESYDRKQLSEAAGMCVEMMHEVESLESVLDLAIAALPERLHDTAYALAVEVAVVDLHLPQEELRWLEMMRDHLSSDRLTTAAIETAARARLRRAI